MKKILLVLLLMVSLIGCGSQPFVAFNYNENDVIYLDEEVVSYNISNKSSLSFLLNPSSNFEDDIIFSANDYIVYNKDLKLKTNKENYVVINFNNKNIEIYVNGELVKKDKTKSNLDLVMFGINDSISGYIRSVNENDNVISSSNVKEQYEDVYPYILLNDLKFNDMDDIQEDFWLYPMANDEFTITWTSDNEDVIKTDKNHGVIGEVDKDTTVRLTATINTDDKIYTKDFYFNVLNNDEKTYLKRDLQSLINDMGYIINDAKMLSNKGYNGSDISWKALAGNCYIDNNILYKDSNASEKENIRLEATLTNGGYEESVEFDLCLLDQYAGYILTYFNGNLEEERGKLAYSYDGLNWIDLNNGDAVLSSELGNGRIRDPFISRDKNGDFVIMATEGFDNPSIYIWQSEDLIDLSNNKLVDIAIKDESLHSTGERAWAPEFTYIPSLDTYYIYYSDPMDEYAGSIYYVCTSDFEEFSYPNSLLNVGYPIIDGTIVNVNGKNYMFYKDERVGATTIFYAQSNDLTKGFGKAYDSIFISPIKQIEGPFIIKNNNEDSYYLYVDYYPKEKFYVAKFTELGNNADFIWLDKSEYQLPNDDVRHGSVVAVTAKELERIIDYYE